MYLCMYVHAASACIVLVEAAVYSTSATTSAKLPIFILSNVPCLSRVSKLPHHLKQGFQSGVT